MSRYLDAQDVPIGLAAFLAYDDYDHIDDPDHISATALLRPTRQLILSQRLSPEQRQDSLYDRLKARMGQALHGAVEDVWQNHLDQALAALGVPEKRRAMVKVNPDRDTPLPPGTIPVYLEQRSFKRVGKYNVSGKFDFVFDGQLQDFKFTSTFTYANQSKAEDYIKQGSIYRWLNPDIITKPTMLINYGFWDWSAAKTYGNNYPPKPVLAQEFHLQPVAQVEHWVGQKLNEIERFSQADDQLIPLCTDKDLWRTELTYKYYANPEKMGRATKVFQTREEAITHQMNKGGKGVIQEHKPEPKACNYCDAKPICGQYKSFVDQGIIKED
jgi:hypothetical protein